MRRILAALIMLFVVAVPTAAHADTSDFTFDSFHADYTLGRDADGTSRLAVVETIVALAGTDVAIQYDTTKPAGQPRRCCDTTKLTAAVGFAPATSLRDGLRRTIEWYRANPLTDDPRPV